MIMKKWTFFVSLRQVVWMTEKYANRQAVNDSPIFEDQMEAIEKTSRSSGEEEATSLTHRWIKGRAGAKNHHRRGLSLFCHSSS